MTLMDLFPVFHSFYETKKGCEKTAPSDLVSIQSLTISDMPFYTCYNTTVGGPMNTAMVCKDSTHSSQISYSEAGCTGTQTVVSTDAVPPCDATMMSGMKVYTSYTCVGPNSL
jgi:hypothetical protein